MNRKQLAVYFIMGSENVTEKKPLALLEEALQGGITMFQFREKGTSAYKGEAYVQFAKACQALCQRYDVPFIVNDDVALALKIGADGIHIGQDDEAVRDVKKRIGSMLLGVSAHTMDDVAEAVANGADYVGIGPIFATTSKDYAKAPAGTDFLSDVAATYPSLPIVAIGGITEDNADQTTRAGADGVAVISTICRSTNVRETIQHLQRSMKKAQVNC